MAEFVTVIKKFDAKGEKSGWTYVEIPAEIANQIFPKRKRSFRVKGKIDALKIYGVSLLPMGNGDFIMPLNAGMRKYLGKRAGGQLKLNITRDTSEYQLMPELVECLEEDSAAKTWFYKLPRSHQNYYSKWIQSAKTLETRTKRLLLTLKACSRQMSYAEMMREARAENELLKRII